MNNVGVIGVHLSDVGGVIVGGDSVSVSPNGLWLI